MKFTEGPWKENNGEIFDQYDNTIAQISRYGVNITPEGKTGPLKHWQANARLIAAAPEIYALINAAIELRKIEEKSGDVVNWPKWFEEASRLIQVIE